MREDRVPGQFHSRVGRRRRGLAVLALAIAALPGAEAGAQTTYTFGVVPQFEPRKMFKIWQPIVEEIEREAGIELKLVVALSVAEFEQKLEAGAFDFVYGNPYHVFRANAKQGYVPIVRDAVPLRGLVLVRRDSPLRSPKDLDGRTLAVPSPNALGASLMIRADLERLFGVRVRVVDVRPHSSAYLNVLNGVTDAAGGVEKTLAQQDKPIRDALRVLYGTRELPSHPVAAHPRVDARSRELVRRALLELAERPTGQALLEAVPMPRPVAASLDDYRVMSAWNLEAYWKAPAN